MNRPLRRIEFAPGAGEYDPDQRMTSHVRRALAWVAGLLTLFLVAMVLIPIGSAVVASGAVGVESRVKRIAHPAGGTIAEIYVQNGDRVTAGQPLMRLQDNVTGQQSRLTSLSVNQLLAQRARLEAEQLGARSVIFPAQLTSSSDPDARRAMSDEARLFQIRRSEEAGLQSQLRQRVEQLNNQIVGLQAQIASLEEQQKLIVPELQGLEELWQKGLATISRVNQLRRTAASLSGSIGDYRAQIAAAQARITEITEQMIQTGETRRSEAGTQLASLNAALNQQQVQSIGAEDLQTRTLIRAPYDGVVDKLAFTTIGDVIRPAETIMEIVPDRDPLLLEVAVSPADVDQLRIGQPARIKFTTVSTTVTPEIKGKLTFVAAERTTNPDTNQSFYEARVSILPNEMERYPSLKLRAGMPAEVFIETGSRSMLSYITKPLRDQISRAFRDS